MPSDWPVRDIEVYCDRCRIVRSLQRIHNLSEDLMDGAVLAVLYGALFSNQQGVLNPAALWPLDERDTDARAAKLCTVFRLIVPTQAAECLLRPSDITKGNSHVLCIVLASLFLNNSHLPSVVPESQVFDYVSSACSGAATETPGITVGNDAVVSEENQSSGAGGDKKDGSQPQVDGAVKEKEQRREGRDKQDLPIKKVATVMESMATHCAYDSLTDLSRLLENDERPEDLLHISPEDILLRWANHKLERKGDEKIRAIGDFRGGADLLELLKIVANDVLSLSPEVQKLSEGKNKAQHEDWTLNVVVDAGRRCTKFAILTKEALREGHTDMIAAFLAGIFLSRPSLPVLPKSQLRKHVDHLCATIRGGNLPEGATFPDLCSWLQETRADFRGAVREVEATQDMQKQVELQVDMFMVDLLCQRAQGSPCMLASNDGKASVSKEVQRIHHLVRLERIEDIIAHEADDKAYADPAVMRSQASLLEDLIRKNTILLKEIFRHYAIRTALGTARAPERQRGSHRGTMRQRQSSVSTALFGRSARASKSENNIPNALIDLRGFTRLHKDCKWRKLKLTPSDVETIYYEVKMADMAANNSGDAAPSQIDDLHPTDGLSMENFIEALLTIGCRAQMYHKYNDIHEKFTLLLEKYIWPYATRPNDDLLYQMSYTPALTPLLQKYDKLLRAIFQTYANLDGKDSSPQGTKPERRGGLAQVGTAQSAAALLKAKRGRTLEAKGFEKMLVDAQLLGGSLTAESIPHIFDGIQHHHEEKEHHRQNKPHAQDEEDEAASKDSESEIYSSSSDDSDDDSKKDETQAAPAAQAAHSGHGEAHLSYMEFIDAIVAVVLYKDPNPFVPFITRFQKLLVDGLLPSLRSYWTTYHRDEKLGQILRIGLDLAIAPEKKALPASIPEKEKKHEKEKPEKKGKRGLASVAAPPSSIPLDEP